MSFSLLCALPVIVMAPGDAPLVTAPADLMEGIPDGYPRFHLAGHEREAALLSRYLWFHYNSRMPQHDLGRTLFNKEYLATADLWMGGARVRDDSQNIQQAFRDCLLTIELAADGYVHTHQHFSHAHDYGWPFPLWPQTGPSINEHTAGWHFQQETQDWQWVYGMIRAMGVPWALGEKAMEGWTLESCRSEGIVENKWRLVGTGGSPAIISPAERVIDAQTSPFVQLRWKRSGEAPEGVRPYIEWIREGDLGFGPDRRVEIIHTPSEFEGVSGTLHCIVAIHEHPRWTGKILQMRLCLAPGETDVTFDIDSFFTVYDTRHSINNPIFDLASWWYFRWTGDVEFLRANIERMRAALRYQQTVMGGLECNHIVNPWVGHDGRPGWTKNADGSLTHHSGHGIGNNYWDLLPFGGHDMYATSQYFASTLAMAEAEEAIRAHPDWGIPLGDEAMDPAELRAHAAAVKAVANWRFWNEETGRFYGWIDLDGVAYDYGFTFVNLEAIWYGIADAAHTAAILDWLTGERIVEGDTSTGEDIYHWRFGPRATTRRNVEVYGQGWTAPESIPWGGQVQDGGAVLGFTVYDLWARLQHLGPDNAWERLVEILAWEDEVWQAGGYREYYKDGSRGTTLQGGGTAGGLGIDHEFWESSMLPSIVVHGFLGLRPTEDALIIEPKLPRACPEMGVRDILYRGARLDVHADAKAVTIAIKGTPAAPLTLIVGGQATEITEAGTHKLPR